MGVGCAGMQPEASEDGTISIAQIQRCIDTPGSTVRLESALACGTRLLATIVQTSEQQSGGLRGGQGLVILINHPDS